MDDESTGLTDDGLRAAFISDDAADGDPANVVDVIDRLASQVRKVADAITDGGASPGHDDHGGRVGCLTEAVMSLGKSMDGVAEGLHAIAEAIRDRPE